MAVENFSLAGVTNGSNFTLLPDGSTTELFRSDLRGGVTLGTSIGVSGGFSLLNPNSFLGILTFFFTFRKCGGRKVCRQVSVTPGQFFQTFIVLEEDVRSITVRATSTVASDALLYVLVTFNSFVVSSNNEK